jgi:nicotinate phosphoribosyltransferase
MEGSVLFNRALLTDFYELTMAAGYFEHGKSSDTATFDLYFRQNPFRGGYAIAAGLEYAVRAVLDTRFTNEDVGFLAGLRSARGSFLFSESFLKYLSGYRFRSTIRAVPEGTVVFANEPLLQVSGSLIECQIVETILLCHINFQTLVATKAARMWEASNRGAIVEFGLRRAQGPDGALSACRAAYIGGADGTSNVLGSALFGVPARGTQAHSWVQSFPSELEAFRAYAQAFPDDCVLLVDTYDVLASGIPNAIRTAKELEQRGGRLSAIRIDSGDLAFLSRRARESLDRAGLEYVRIVASNELDEYLIAEILAEGGKIDSWGVGTRLVTGEGAGGASLGGIYKMVEHNGKPKIKVSNNPTKTTNPGAKKVVRFYSEEGLMEADALAAVAEDLRNGEVEIIDPINPLRRKRLRETSRVELLRDIVIDGQLVYDFPSMEGIRTRRVDQLNHLHDSYKRLHNPHEYKVGLTFSLWQQKEGMLTQRVS